MVGLLVCVARQGYKAWFCSFVILCLDSTMTLAKNEKCVRVGSWLACRVVTLWCFFDRKTEMHSKGEVLEGVTNEVLLVWLV